MVGTTAHRGYPEPMAQFTLSMPPALQDWIDTRLAEGRYVDAAEYLRDLVRRDMEAATVRRVRAMIEEGLASGVIDRDPRDIVAELIEDIDQRD